MSSVDLLALPKGSSWVCEICHRPGTIICAYCQKTYYCSKNHKMLDWEAFHTLICKDLAFIRSEHPFPIEEAERQIIKEGLRKKQIEIQAKAHNLGKDYLLKGNPEYAYAAAMQAFYLHQELFGDTTEEVIFPYVLVSEVYLALGNIQLAKEFMLQAAWTVEKNTKMVVNILKEVHRVKGLVHLHCENWQNAKEAFAEYVYCLSEQYGTSHISVGVGFGYLGLTLHGLKKFEVVLGLYNKMFSLWMDYLLDLYISNGLRTPTEEEMEDTEIRETEYTFLEACNVFQEVDKTLQMYRKGEKFYRIIFRMYVVQAMLSIRKGDMKKKDEYVESALIVATKKRMDNIVKPEKRNNLCELLGEDYLLRWKKKHVRPRTIATPYLENVFKLSKELEKRAEERENKKGTD